MPARPSISQRQRQILHALRQHDYARFAVSDMRQFYIREALLDGEAVGGVTIYAYQEPETFLLMRDLIERVKRNVPGRWFRLTDQGRAYVTPRERQPRRERPRRLLEITCFTCDGQGANYYAGDDRRRCHACRGTGSVKVENSAWSAAG